MNYKKLYFTLAILLYFLSMYGQFVNNRIPYRRLTTIYQEYVGDPLYPAGWVLTDSYPLVNDDTYEPVRYFETSQLGSDYGPRNHSIFWHRGLDYGDNVDPNNGDSDLGFALCAINGGTIFDIFSYSRSNGYPTRYKGITINDGMEIFQYCHLFTDHYYLPPEVQQGGLRCGNFIFTKLQNSEDELVIVYFKPFPFMGDQIVVLSDQDLSDAVVGLYYVDDMELTYGTWTVQTTNVVQDLQEIGPLGNSGGDFSAHLHLSRLDSEVIYPATKENFNNPLQFLEHYEPEERN